MGKKLLCLLLIVLLGVPLFGCWNYRGLDQMVIVTGFAIDKNPKTDGFKISFQTVDMTTPIKQNGLTAKIIESEGKTIFEAVRNAKKRISSKLYFGHAQVVVLSEEIARGMDIGEVIDWFIRDSECRETLCFIVSQQPTAREILSIDGIDRAIVSSEIREILESDSKITASTAYIELYEMYNILESEGRSLVLPAIRNVLNDGEPASEINGSAVFKGDRMVGFLTAEESKYYLFAIDEIKGGIFAFSSGGETADATLEISKNTTRRSFEYSGGKVKFFVKTNTTAYLGEFMGEGDVLDEKQIAAMEAAAEAELSRGIADMIRRVCADYDADIFGFGNFIYKHNPRLWSRLKDTWDEQFQSLEVEVQSEIHIANTASAKNEKGG